MCSCLVFTKHHLCLIPEYTPKLALQNACVAAQQEINELKHSFDVCPFHLFLFSADSCARQHGVTHNRASAHRAWTSHTATPCVLLTSENSIELLKKCCSEGITEFGFRSVVMVCSNPFTSLSHPLPHPLFLMVIIACLYVFSRWHVPVPVNHFSMFGG